MAPIHFTRRALIAGAASIAATRPTFAFDLEDGAAIANVPAARKRVASFLESLDETKRARARFALGTQTWSNWNYFGTRLIKPGLPLAEMDDAQHGAALDLLASVFSDAGMDKADRVMALQDVLAARGDSRRSRDNFSFAVYGEPGADNPWAFRVEGHHLTATATFVGDDLVSVTPSAFSCNPNQVTTGAHRGMVALTDEEKLARTLFADLQGASARAARISDKAYRNILTSAGREDSLTRAEGVPISELRSGQTDLLWALVETFAVEHLRFDIADSQRDRIRSGDAASVHFAWGGENREGTPFYYRVTGPTFVVELATVDRDAQHLHTIYHDIERSLGRHAVTG